MSRKKTLKAEHGFTLIEVLIGLILLTAIGLAFTSALQFTGKDYQTARFLNRASQLATSEVEFCKDLAVRGDFKNIDASSAGAHPAYNITWAVSDFTIDNTSNPVNAGAGDEVYFKEVIITVTHKTRPDISTKRIIRVGPR